MSHFSKGKTKRTGFQDIKLGKAIDFKESFKLILNYLTIEKYFLIQINPVKRVQYIII